MQSCLFLNCNIEADRRSGTRQREAREHSNAAANVAPNRPGGTRHINAKVNERAEATVQHSTLIRDTVSIDFPLSLLMTSKTPRNAHAHTQTLCRLSLSLRAVCLPPLSIKICSLLCLQNVIRCLCPIFGAENDADIHPRASRLIQCSFKPKL